MCVYYEIMADIVTKFTFGIQELYTEYKFTTSKQIKMKFHLFRCCTFNSSCIPQLFVEHVIYILY